MEFNNIVEVFVEISKNSNIKYEFDKDKKHLVCDRILHTPFLYFFNYGFIDKTLSLDGDPIDVVIIMEEPLINGCTIKCKIIGALETSDDEGDDPKLIVCPIGKIDPKSKNINNINDLNSNTIEKIKYFFQHYKDLENKIVKIGNFIDRDYAINVYKQSIINFNNSN